MLYTFSMTSSKLSTGWWKCKTTGKFTVSKIIFTYLLIKSFYINRRVHCWGNFFYKIFYTIWNGQEFAEEIIDVGDIIAHIRTYINVVLIINVIIDFWQFMNGAK